MATPIVEGRIPVRGYHTAYRVVGDLAATPAGLSPVLLLHGNPVSHESLEPLQQLAASGRPVIFYDQIGCGQSDRPDDPALWSMDLFVEEVAAVRRALRLERTHLLGHSWGGMVAMEYALRQPSGLVSLILASTAASDAGLGAAVARLREGLPPGVQETLRRHEEAGTTDDPEYQAADRVFALRHICRIDPWPDFLQRALARPSVSAVSLDGWDIRARLGGIAVPTLITCGRHDLPPPNLAEDIHRGIVGSDLVVFEGSSHYAHAEEPGRYLSVLLEFLGRVERGATAHA